MVSQMDYAYKFIKNCILNGTYRPAQKLNESDLSEEIGVSRNTVKKALLKLEKENLLLIEANKGATIKSFTLQEILNYIEIRAVLEEIIIRSVIENISEKQLNLLEDHLVTMKVSVNQGLIEEYSKQNDAFHNLLYKISSKHQAVEMVKVIKTQLKRYHFKSNFVPGRTTQSLEEHEAILNAIKARDINKAVQTLKTHILNGGDVIQKHFHLLQ